MRGALLVLDGDEVSRLPDVCVRDGWPATDRVLKTFRAARTSSRLFRYSFGVPFWLLSLVYRPSRQVAVPVCDRCARMYRFRRALVWVAVAGIVLGLGDMAIHGPDPKVGSGYLAPLIYLACLPLLLAASIWVWRYPAYGVVKGTRVRLRGISPHFKNAFQTNAAVSVSSLFTWPGPSDHTAAAQSRVALAGVEAPVTTKMPRHATAAGDPVTGWVFHAKRAGIAVIALAALTHAVVTNVHAFRAHHPASAQAPAPTPGLPRVLGLSDLPGRFNAETPASLAFFDAQCQGHAPIAGWDVRSEGHTFITADERESASQMIVRTTQAPAIYSEIVSRGRSCRAKSGSLNELRPASGPAIGDESTWWRETAAAGYVWTPRYLGMSSWFVFLRKGDALMEVDAKSQQQAAAMARRALAG